MATDKNGKAVSFGDYLIVDASSNEAKWSGVVRIIKLAETTKGTSALGAFVDLVGHGRVAKMKIDVTKGTLVARSNGEVVA